MATCPGAPSVVVSEVMLKSALAALLTLGIGASAAHADAVEDFYKGKTVTIVTSTGVGGPFDLTARALEILLRNEV